MLLQRTFYGWSRCHYHHHHHHRHQHQPFCQCQCFHTISSILHTGQHFKPHLFSLVPKWQRRPFLPCSLPFFWAEKQKKITFGRWMPHYWFIVFHSFMPLQHQHPASSSQPVAIAIAIESRSGQQHTMKINFDEKLLSLARALVRHIMAKWIERNGPESIWIIFQNLICVQGLHLGARGGGTRFKKIKSRNLFISQTFLQRSL